MDRYEQHDAALVDAALLLTLWQRCAIRQAHLGSRTRLMKLAFLAANCLSEQQVFGFNLEFLQWKYGPSSSGVIETWRLLERSGHVREEEVLELTERGSRLAHDFYRDVICREEFGPLREMVDALAAQWASCEDDMLLCEHASAVNAAANGEPVSDAAKGDTLVKPPEAGRPIINLETEPAWVETLALEFSPRDRAGVQRAVEDFRAGRIRVA